MVLIKRFFPFIAALALLVLPGAALSEELGPGEGYIRSADGVRLFYKVEGNGPQHLVVLHGGPGNTMFSVLPDFAPLAEKYTVVYYDQRGNGRSGLVEEHDELALRKHIEDLEAVRKYFKLDKLTLLGNSWGGLLVSFYALAHPDKVERLILHSPASPSYDILRTSTPHIYRRIPKESLRPFFKMSDPWVWRVSSDPLELCRKFYDLLRPVYFSDVARAEKMRGDVCAGPLDAVRRQLSVNKTIWEVLGEWDIVDELAAIETPALVIHGSYDMIPLESSIAWTEALPNARLLIIKDSGHMTHVERPEVFFPAVEKFLGGEWPEEAIALPIVSDNALPLEIEIFRP